MTGAEIAVAERRRQIEVKGWTPEHDAIHIRGQLIRAAICYATEAEDIVRNPAMPLTVGEMRSHMRQLGFPWDARFCKPSKDAVRNLAKAAALLMAEIDRLQAREARLKRKEAERAG